MENMRELMQLHIKYMQKIHLCKRSKTNKVNGNDGFLKKVMEKIKSFLNINYNKNYVLW